MKSIETFNWPSPSPPLALGGTDVRAVVIAFFRLPAIKLHAADATDGINGRTYRKSQQAVCCLRDLHISISAELASSKASGLSSLPAKGSGALVPPRPQRCAGAAYPVAASCSMRVTLTSFDRRRCSIWFWARAILRCQLSVVVM